MSRFNTGSPIDSDDLKDLSDNAKNADLFSNDVENESYTDRFGRKRKTIHGMALEFSRDQKDREDRFNEFLLSSGYQFAGDYAAGVELTEYNQVVRDGDGEFWRVSGKTELPYTLTGSGVDENGALVSVGDTTLRQDLANPDKGAAMVARGVVAVDSIADLLALPEGQRKEGLRYLVNGYHAGSVVGGGEFYWDESMVGENDGGGVLDGFVRIPTETITPRMFGAIPGVPESQTNLLQAAMNYCGANGVRLVVDDVYYVSATAWDVLGTDPYAVRTPSNLDMMFGPKGHLIQIGAPELKSSVLLIVHAENVRVWFPRITGTRLTEDPSLPEQNHGLRILECENVIVYKPVISNTMGDGIYIGRTWLDEGWKFPLNVVIYEPVIDRVRRNGISCCAWRNVRIIRPRITNVRDIDGVASLAPRAGIDIEPESAGTNHSDRIATDGLFIEDPTILDCVTAFIAYYQPLSIGQQITVDVTGTLRIRATGMDWAARPFSIQNMGLGCTGHLRIERIVDESPAPSPDGGFHWGAILQNNAQPIPNALFVTIDEWIVEKQTSGIYAWVCVMLDTPARYSYYQGNIEVRNIQLPPGVVGNYGHRCLPELNNNRETRNLTMQISYENAAKGYPGIINSKSLNTGTIPQGPNCYFDGIVTLDSSITNPSEIYGNRFTLSYTGSANIVVDISEKVGTYEIIRHPINSTTATIAIKGISLGGSNSFVSSSTSAGMVVRKTGVDTTTTSVVSSHGGWVPSAL